MPAEVSASVAAPRRFDYIPLGIGAGNGLVAGVLSSYGGSATSTGVQRYRMGIYKLSVLGLGLFGEIYAKWDPDITYGLMCSTAALLAEQVAPALKGGDARRLFTNVAPGGAAGAALSRPVRVRPALAAGCTACAQHAHGDVVHGEPVPELPFPYMEETPAGLL